MICPFKLKLCPNKKCYETKILGHNAIICQEAHPNGIVFQSPRDPRELATIVNIQEPDMTTVSKVCVCGHYYSLHNHGVYCTVETCMCREFVEANPACDEIPKPYNKPSEQAGYSPLGKLADPQFIPEGGGKETKYRKEIVEDVKLFTSGAKSSGNVPPYECLTPLMLRRAALRMQLGMHYGKHNWKKGIDDKSFILDRLNHAFEHLTKATREIDSDQIMIDDDLAAVVVNCMFAMEYQNALTRLQGLDPQKR